MRAPVVAQAVTLMDAGVAETFDIGDGARVVAFRIAGAVTATAGYIADEIIVVVGIAGIAFGIVVMVGWFCTRIGDAFVVPLTRGTTMVSPMGISIVAF